MVSRIAKKPRYEEMDGILYPPPFSKKCFREVLDYKPRPGDVFIVTYPKCGTTWMQNVALYIFRKGKELENTSLFHTYCPFIDCFGLESIKKMPRPGALKTHLPFNHMPYSPEAKYIFVARNPKDCCVSFYHHAKSPAFDFEDGKFEDFFEAFMDGQVEYNDYFHHLLSWYPHRNDPNVFYTTYEHMKEDIKDVIIKLAAFLGKEFVEAIEKDNAVLNNIIHYSSFEYMKQNIDKEFNKPPNFKKDLQNSAAHEDNKMKSHFQSKTDPNKCHIRKGVIGDYKSLFTLEQTKRLDKKFLERTSGTDIPKWFPQV